MGTALREIFHSWQFTITNTFNGLSSSTTSAGGFTFVFEQGGFPKPATLVLLLARIGGWVGARLAPRRRKARASRMSLTNTRGA